MYNLTRIMCKYYLIITLCIPEFVFFKMHRSNAINVSKFESNIIPGEKLIYKSLIKRGGEIECL